MHRNLPLAGCWRHSAHAVCLLCCHAEMRPRGATQVNDFWQLLEVATNERQRVLLGAMNVHLAALSHTIEATVGELLDIQLEEAHIGLEQPSAAQWHETLDDLFAIGECCTLWAADDNGVPAAAPAVWQRLS